MHILHYVHAFRASFVHSLAGVLAAAFCEFHPLLLAYPCMQGRDKKLTFCSCITIVLRSDYQVYYVCFALYLYNITFCVQTYTILSVNHV